MPSMCLDAAVYKDKEHVFPVPEETKSGGDENCE